MRPLCAVAAAMALLISAAPLALSEGTDSIEHVDPMIGTLPPGFTNPGPIRPHGMVHLGPDTEGPFNYGGYLSNNALITGFSHVHMSAGVVQGGQFPLMPILGDPLDLQLPALPAMPPLPSYASPFTKVGEVSEAGYYAVDLLRYGIRAELTATERVGVHRYHYPPGATPMLVFHPGRDLKGPQAADITFLDEQTILSSVSTTGPDHTVHSALRLDRPVTAKTLDGSPFAPGDELAGTGIGIVLQAPGDRVLRADVGISFVDREGALSNLAAESDLGDFDPLREQSRAAWRTTLSSITVEGGTAADRKTFYTALYRARSFPTLLSDADGRYPGADDAIHQDDRPHYTNFSMWDSYRGHNALLATTDPERYRDFLASLRDFSEQGGRLPRWQLANRDPAYMSGNPVIPLIAEGICRNIAEPDLEEDLYRQVWGLVAAERPESLDRLGYLPIGSPSNPIELLEGGSRDTGTTLEYAVADAALALMADRRGAHSDREVAVAGSQRWRNLLDPETRWIRPRDEAGDWSSPFLPESGYGFQEGTSWQYSWLVMHDMAGLIEAMGGADRAMQRLDTMFAFPLSAIPIVWPKIQNQLTVFGLVYLGNQFAPGNEHNLQLPFLYNWSGAPWKTQAVARSAASLYTPTIDGLPGNDDLGALSGWLVWTMLGLHPTVPGAPAYTLASPVFTRAVIGDLVIEAPGAGPAAGFVTGVELDGKPLSSPWFVERDLGSAGSTLRFEVGALPDPSWGTGSPPPSFSTHPLDAFGCSPPAEANTTVASRTQPAQVAAQSANAQVPALPATGGGSPFVGLGIGLAALVAKRSLSGQIPSRPWRRALVRRRVR